MNEYWSARVEAAVNAAKGDVSIEDLPIRTNETSNAYSVRFNGVGNYPLYAYLHVPKSDGPHVPLFQAPGYGSVVAVPPYERRAAYVVLALCHRGQRLSNSQYSAAYPGLLTDGLPGEDTYVWGDIVADCITAVQILLQQPNIDTSRISITGGDLALMTAALTEGVHALQSGGLMFADIENRIAGNPDYPLAEFNDFKRTYPDAWDEALAMLSNYDPMRLAGRIDAEKVMLSTGASEKSYYDNLATALSGETTVRVNLGKGHLDHVAQEEWLAAACGIEPGPAHYPRELKTGTSRDLSYFTPYEPLIIFHVDRAIAEGRSIQNAVEGWWVINHRRASTYSLVLAKKANMIIGAYRPISDSWSQRWDGRWGFKSERADDVWHDYVGKKVPAKLRGQNPVRYVDHWY